MKSQNYPKILFKNSMHKIIPERVVEFGSNQVKPAGLVSAGLEVTAGVSSAGNAVIVETSPFVVVATN